MNAEPLDYPGFVHLVIEALNAAGVEFLIGGAVAVWAWGEPRGTLDLDLVIHLPIENIKALSIELQNKGMLVPEELLLDAFLEDRADLPVQAIHGHSGFKADLYLLRPGDELRRTAFSRRRLVDLGPPIGPVYLHSPEDLILYKLLSYSLSQQTKHLRDITAIVLNVGDALDIAYIHLWAERKGLSSLWQDLWERIQRPR